MRAPHLKLSFCFCLLFLLTKTSIAQEENPTEHPYGGIIDSLGRLTFREAANLFYATFDSAANFEGAIFHKEVSFFRATFHKEADFRDDTFHKGVSFLGATFHNDARFGGAIFDSLAGFNNATFHKKVNFREATFNNKADFSYATFEDITTFQNPVFKGAVYFNGTTFIKEIDFRQANFDSLESIYLENIIFPQGEFRFYWKQLKGKDSLRIKIKDPPADSIKDEHYTRIEIIYHKLRDNFIAQGDKASADDVMYELDWQRDEILNEFHWQMYGVFFGYGYQPWRFLLFVVLPLIIMFAGIWYWFYYAILVFLNPSLFPKISEARNLTQKDKYLLRLINNKGIKLRITDFSYGLNNINRLTRYWHTLFFSTSVLLGIRFKKEWTKDLPENMLGRKSFIYFVTFEWMLGILLLVLFVLLVKGIRFSFIKDLLGF